MDVKEASQKIYRLFDNIEKVLRGKSYQVKLAIIALLSDGHLLIQDVPGVGKTVLARAIAGSISLTTKRVQCTPDLLPADITGSMVYDGKGDFHFVPGPVFSEILLVDEINRATPRTQSALLEAMDERKVSVDGETRNLPKPFFLIATLNPAEHHGVFSLPEGQLDRFLLRISLGYPDAGTEKDVVRAQMISHPVDKLQPVMKKEELLELQEAVRNVKVSDDILAYAQNIIGQTRKDERLLVGASPRATIGLVRTSQANALISERDFVIPDDIKMLAKYVIPHRIGISSSKRLMNKDTEIIEDILKKIDVPV